MNKYFKKIALHFSSLNPRERSLVIIGAVIAFALAIYFPYSWISGYVQETNRLSIVRKRDLNDVNSLLNRYNHLKGKLDTVQKSFKEAQMTFEEVTKEIDTIIKSSLGDDASYDFKKPKSPSKLGLDYEKQEFSLKIKSATLNQIVKLLFALEQGNRPLFLGKIDLRRVSRTNSYSTTLEIFSVRKQRG